MEIKLVDVFVCALPTNRSRVALNALLVNVSDEKQKRIQQFYHLDDAYRTLIGDLLIGSIFYKRTGIHTKDVAIKKNAYGKPFFPEYPFIQYNISHSGDYVVCVVHEHPVGIDVEKVQPFDLQLAKQLFTTMEYGDILCAENRSHACYDIWTIKESYVKALGKGLAIPLNSFQVRKTNRNEIELFDIHAKKRIKEFVCKQYRIDEDYKLTVCAYCAETNHIIPKAYRVSFNSLCDEVMTS